MFMMLLLVLGANYLVMFVGWEGVGLCSYLLIGFYYDKNFAADAGKKAFIINRIGDFGFILGDLPDLQHVRHARLRDRSSRRPPASTRRIRCRTLTAICLLLFVGACGKSAQVPLYVWLPDAMAGPTPVSALIHAATMVTAGVYMVVRSNVLFRLSPDAMLVVAIVGGITAIFAATIGLAQNDIKKVLAYSTVSQLGYMFLAAGVGAFTAAIFHVMTHAFFKACLFLGAGSVIHALRRRAGHAQDGRAARKMPITHCHDARRDDRHRGHAAARRLLLEGRDPRGGVRVALHPRAVAAEGLWISALITAGLTAFYMFRLFHSTFTGSSAALPSRRPTSTSRRRP